MAGKGKFLDRLRDLLADRGQQSLPDDVYDGLQNLLNSAGVPSSTESRDWLHDTLARDSCPSWLLAVSSHKAFQPVCMKKDAIAEQASAKESKQKAEASIHEFISNTRTNLSDITGGAIATFAKDVEDYCSGIVCGPSGNLKSFTKVSKVVIGVYIRVCKGAHFAAAQGRHQDLVASIGCSMLGYTGASIPHRFVFCAWCGRVRASLI
jgi:hypothetical protein